MFLFSTNIFLKNVARCHNFLCTKLDMTGGKITNILQDNEASVVSQITSVENINIYRGLWVDNKKREINE